jgi:hypothetical protein
MTLAELIAEGEALARACSLLGEKPTDRVGAYWNGERGDRPNSVPPTATAVRSQQHIITIDKTLMNDLGMKSRYSPGLFEVDYVGRGDRPSVEVDETEFRDIPFTGIRLYATAGTSFPPFEAICLYGSGKVETWLRSKGLERYQYEYAAQEPLAEEYNAEFMRRSPLYTRGADAVVGGWHMMWPADDFFFPLEIRLVVLTMREAEPYWEIYTSVARPNFIAKVRFS